jgi:signal transduction histidine kinase
MAQRASEPYRLWDRSLPEALVRTLRHEIGDLLQKVYASIAILQDRLPAEREMERGVLARLYSRSEMCRRNLDMAHDLICPVCLDYQPVDLTQTAQDLAAWAKGRHPNLLVAAEGDRPAVIHADAKRVRQIGELLLSNALDAARSRVGFSTRLDADRNEATWTIRDDGPGIGPDLADNLFRPFFTTRAGHSGLGLALARKLVDLHGGQIRAGNRPEGGFEAQVAFPLQPPAELSETSSQ